MFFLPAHYSIFSCYFNSQVSTRIIKHNQPFLVYSDNCKIKAHSIFTNDTKLLPLVERTESCSQTRPLVSIDTINGNKSVLSINAQFWRDPNPVTCCYQIIEWQPTELDRDAVRYLKCVPFTDGTLVPEDTEFILTHCSRQVGGSNVFDSSRAHALVPQKASIVARQEKFATKHANITKLSVLIIGIDGMSRLNLHRSMPKTADYLTGNGWTELLGFNKIGENSLPNLMALLTGKYLEKPDHCLNNPRHCKYIFDMFREEGYVTVYAEDQTNSSVLPFEGQPTDYYIRPLFNAAEKILRNQPTQQVLECVGNETSAEVILRYAHQFMRRFRERPFFGMFWMTSFRSSMLNDASQMDELMTEWFKVIRDSGVYENSMVLFVSDQGVRVGKARETEAGWFEERLPFALLWLPQWFHAANPDIAGSLRINTRRLTSPYDLYLTMLDVLVRTKMLHQVTPTSACPKCGSLFREVNASRTCPDAGIATHWCSCHDYALVSTQIDPAPKVADFVLGTIVGLLNADHDSRTLCAKLQIAEIIEFKETIEADKPYYTIRMEVAPGGAIYEATAGFEAGSFHILGDIIRLNQYGSDNICVDTNRKFCYCKERFI